MRKLLLTLSISAFLLCGCYKTDQNIITGVTKLQRASDLISEHNLEHCKEKYEFYVLQKNSAETEEEKAKWQELADKELEYIMANTKFPEKMMELLETLKDG